MNTQEAEAHIAGKTCQGKVEFLLSLNQVNNLKISNLLAVLNDICELYDSGYLLNQSVAAERCRKRMFEDTRTVMERAGQ
jgi:hypothetical protein